MAEKHVAARQHHAAVFNRREIDLGVDSFQAIPLRQHFTVNAQTRDAAVGIDVETQVRPTLVAVYRKRIERIAVQIRLRQNVSPLL